MKPTVINGRLWRVIRVPLESPELVDRTGFARLGTTDYMNRLIFISDHVFPPLLDKVLLHEVAHAAIEPMKLDSQVDESAAQAIENHGLEAIEIASSILGRPVCVNGFCS